MCVFFHFTDSVSQPSELFQEGQPLDIQNRYGEFWMVQLFSREIATVFQF